MESSPGDPLALALRALAHKERSVAELGEWLRERGVASEDAESVLNYLVEIDVLDDRRFAARYAEDKREIAGWGSERIRDALVKRGISSDDAEAAVAAEGDELERALAVLAERSPDLDDEAGRGKAFGFLVRRGFGADLAYEAIRRAGDRPDLA